MTNQRERRVVTPEGVIAVYMLASKKNGTIYVGVTSDLAARTYQHKTGAVRGFTSRYGVKRLVWYLAHDSIVEAIAHEKRLKKYPRALKVNLIEEMNPEWFDLYMSLNR
jgi:putative endonuclease